VFLGHFFGPIRAVIPVIAGMAAMRQIPFQIANITSAFLWAGGVIAPSFFGVAWLMGH
jgi:membrane protein DedA with SNARE-associated domain